MLVGFSLKCKFVKLMFVVNAIKKVFNVEFLVKTLNLSLK